MEKYIVKNGKELRFGYTTGSCAAAAATAAAKMLITACKVWETTVTLPKGEEIVIEIGDVSAKADYVKCSVVKDGGDDPDATHGAKIFAKVSYTDGKDIIIKGGEGVGIVTAKGLQCDVGQPAINPVPQKMIRENVRRVMDLHHFDGGLEIEISVPQGMEIAKKTYNPRLGIVGGISILGTTGIVEPMSEKALVDTIKVEIDKRYAEDPDYVLIAPGNYGKDFCKEVLALDIEKAVIVSNYIGEALDYIRYKGFKEILFVGHTGKLIKTAAGIMNTHSSYADGRMEIIAVQSALAGATTEVLAKIMDAVTTDQAFDIIKAEPFYEEVKARILERCLYHLEHRLRGEAKIETVMFTTDRSHIIKSNGAGRLIKYFAEERQ